MFPIFIVLSLYVRVLPLLFAQGLLLAAATLEKSGSFTRYNGETVAF